MSKGRQDPGSATLELQMARKTSDLPPGGQAVATQSQQCYIPAQHADATATAMTDPKTRVNRMERLFTAARRLAAEPDPGRLVEDALDAVAAFVDADQGFLLLREDNGRPRVRATINLDHETMRSERFKPLRQIAERVLRRGEPFLSASLDVDSRVNPADSQIDAARSVVAIPMRAQHSVAGVIYAERYHDGSGAFGVSDLRVLQSCADLVAELVFARQTCAALRAEIADLSRTRTTLERVTANLNEEVAAKSVELAQFASDLDSKNRALADKHALSELVGATPQMQRIFETVERVANYPVPVLLTGEAGTGKTALARAIHHHSVCRESPFLALNCTALPAALLESELFGTVGGPADSDGATRPGLLLEARDGTVLLKEVDALTPALQARLSNALRDNEVLTNDGPKDLQARIIVTNRAPLQDALELGFSEDLYHQLNVIEITLPPLRERYYDIPALAQHINARQAQDLNLPERPFSAGAMQMLVRFGWPGNIRQLSSTIRSSALLCRGAIIEVDDLRLPSGSADLPPEASMSMEMVIPASGVQTRTEWEAKEKQAILDALVQSNWNKTRAAELLGVSRRNLYRKLARYGIEGS